MQKRAGRISLVALLLAAGAAAAVLVWQNELTLQSLDRDRRARDEAVERLAPAVAGIAAAQQAYVDSGQRDEAAFTRVSTLLDQITTDAAGLRSSDTSSAGADLEEFWAALSALTAAHADARKLLAQGESLVAADTLFVSARPHVATLDERLRAFRDAEISRSAATRTSVTQQSWLALGAVGIAWAFGLIALARLPEAEPRQAFVPATAPVDSDLSLVLDEARGDPAPGEERSGGPSLSAGPSGVKSTGPLDGQDRSGGPAAAPGSDDEGPLKVDIALSPSVDLGAAADLCASVSRLTDATALPDILARAAAIIEARGLILWMGAGDELFPATSWGYDPAVVARLRPIKRTEDNATAAAWRDGSLRVVASDVMSHGAIVAPMFDAASCIGVLAAEVRNGREDDHAVRAVAGIIASQLATVLSAWPAPSTSTESDRKAAAS